MITPDIWTMNRDVFDGLSPEHQYLVNWAAEVAAESGRAMSRVIEASQEGLPALSAKMRVHVASPAKQAKFAAAAQPAVRAPIEAQYGEAGVAMLDSLLASVEEENGAF